MFGELHAQFFLPSSINGIIFVTTLVKNVSEFLGWVVFHLISPILFSFLFRAPPMALLYGSILLSALFF